MSRSYDPVDPYFRKAKAEGYLARSVYKLQEIDQRYQLLRRGMTVIDLGAAPGSWTQYLLHRVGQQGQVIAIDKQPIAVTAPNLRFYQVDIEAPTLEAGVGPIQAEGIVSDMAPATSGSRVTDQARSARLVQRSLELAQRWLRPGGFWIAKLLEGPELPRLLAQAQPHFQKITTFRPKATRKGSTECFLIGRLYKKVP